VRKTGTFFAGLEPEHRDKPQLKIKMAISLSGEAEGLLKVAQVQRERSRAARRHNKPVMSSGVREGFWSAGGGTKSHG